jgi:hypothetical protein
MRLKVPLVRSPLIASKPKMMPSRGPKKLMKNKNEGNPPPDEVKRPRNKYSSFKNCCSFNASEAVYEEKSPVITMIKVINMNLLLPN